jgi:hypothetical protein
MNCTKIEWDGVGLIHLAEDRAQWWSHVYMVTNIVVP